MKISTQVRLAMAFSAVLAIGLGAVAWYQASLLWQQTSSLYEHPLMVQMAIGDVRDDIGLLSSDIRSLLRATSPAERDEIARRIEQRQSDLDQQLATIRELYLGPSDDVDSLSAAIGAGRAIRAETMRLARAGRLAEAEARIRSGAIQDAQVALIRQWTQHIDDFATARSVQFYTEATARHSQLQVQLAIAVMAAVLGTLLISGALVRGILAPMRALTTAAERFRAGQLEERCGYSSDNELGVLANAFDTMAAAIQAELALGARVEEVSGVMLVEEEPRAFWRALLDSLMAHTGSQVGAVYLLNGDRTAFEHFHSVGLGTAARTSFSVSEHEGELGRVLASRRIEHLRAVPAHSRFAFSAVSGTITPRAIVTIPILADHAVSAVISLGSLNAYDDASLRLLETLWTVMTARVNGVLAFLRVQQLAQHLEQQNRELDAQKHELAAQAGEMSAQAGELVAQNAELERQKLQLGESNRLKSAFLANMSHELRTPLNSVIALAGVLHRRLDGRIPPDEFGYLEVIERNGRSLLTLINDILDLSRIEAGRADLSYSDVSVRHVVHEVLEMVAPAGEAKQLTLRNETADDLPALPTDHDKLRHILQNLVGNAVKFTEQGTVTVRAAVDGDVMRIAVSDTGIGIAEAQRAHIFDEFRQADESTSRRYGGTGLGLAIAKRYAELLGGDLSVESTLGRGSTFTLCLPRARRALHRPDAAAPAPSGRSASRLIGAQPPQRGQGECILLVDDNEPAIIQLTDLLETGGYTVLVARNGREALARIDERLPDAMILDLMMPEVDGFEVLTTVRNDPRSAELPVLILTAHLVSKEELSALSKNNVRQLIQKGDINGAGLLSAVARMVAPADVAGPQGRHATPPAAPGARTPPTNDSHAFRVRRARRTPHRERPIVLVVEDNADNMRTARALLSERYEVDEAVDAPSGLAQARRHPPDVILMDIALPGMDGVQALHQLRRDEALRDVPVIAVTASAMKGDRDAILAQGFDGYVSKPVDHRALHMTIAGVLG